MKSKKENLIGMLRGNIDSIKEAVKVVKECDMYNDNGHVDCYFLTKTIEIVSEFMTITTELQKAIGEMLGVDETADVRPKKAQGKGAAWKPEDILRNCTLENGVLKLPSVQFSKESYAVAKKWIEEAGGRWVGGKVQGFEFPFNPDRVFKILHEGKRCKLQQEFQFFETPRELADWLVMLAGGIMPNDTILEPSAGRGGLIKAIHRTCPGVTVDCFELMPENKEILATLEGVQILGDDFTKECNKMYDKIIANPPFSGNQDIKHTRIMYNHLAEGGSMAVITSTHWLHGSESICEEFRNWLDSVGGKIHNISAGTFQESGTNIETVAIVITKQ